MKNIYIIALTALIAASCGDKSGSKVAFKNLNDSFSYAYGMYTGSNMRSADIKEINWELFQKALEKSMKDGDSNMALDLKTSMDVLNRYFTISKYGKNIEAGKKFIEDRLKDGFTKTTSGLLYKVVTKGNGIKPTLMDTALITITGKKINGQIIDSNEGQEPYRIPMNMDIPLKGIQEVVSMIEEGAEIEAILPYNLAYEIDGRRDERNLLVVEPYETVIYRVKLNGIKR